MQTYNSIQPIIAKHAFHRYQMDLMSLIAYSDVNNNYKYILVVIDCYSKFIWAFSLITKSPTHVKTSLLQIFNTFAPPKILQSDNGKEFKNSTLNDLCEEYNIVFVHGRPRKPTTQGQVERSNSTIKSCISRLLALETNKIWFKQLDKVVVEYNTTVHSSHKKTPKEIMFEKKMLQYCIRIYFIKKRPFLFKRKFSISIKRHR
ncbi:Pro-Pol polyprotein [Cucumispora dikerogammari]|nr:Pro-Pol polyprotein [Cucumispora dikerogammari]